MILGCAVFCGCTPRQDPAKAPVEGKPQAQPTPTDGVPQVVLEAPVPFWEDGSAKGQVDAAKAIECPARHLDIRVRTGNIDMQSQALRPLPRQLVSGAGPA